MAIIEATKSLLGGRQAAIALGLLLSFIIPSFIALAEEEARPIIVVPRRNMDVVYINCAPCHKMDGSGGGGYGGVAASFVLTQLNHEELIGVITNGRPEKGMPPWKGVLNPTEIEAMATYIEQKFKGKVVAVQPGN